MRIVFPFFFSPSTTPMTRKGGNMGEEGKVTKPSFDDVLKYAKPLLRKFVSERCADLPIEQKEEIYQDASIRLWEAYQGLDPERGWKSFVYNHCFGTVMDYLKSGKGFEEESWSIKKEEEHEAIHVNKIRHRVSIVNSEDDTVDIDQVLGMHGKFADAKVGASKINWELLSRMASVDLPLRAFLQHIRGHNLEEIAATRGQSRTRVGQLVQEFIDRFDDPDLAADPWMDQVIWALGLSSHFDLEDCDQSEIHGIPLGQTLPAVDLDNETPWPKQQQMALFA